MSKRNGCSTAAVVGAALAVSAGACGVDSRALDVVAAPSTSLDSAAGAGGAMQPVGTGNAGSGADGQRPPAVVAPGDAGLESSTLRLEFEAREVGSLSEPLGWVVTNGARNAVALPLTNSNPEEFQVIQGCPAALGAGASCTLQVRFSPRGPGARAGYLELGEAPAALPLQLVGAGQYRVTVTTSGASGTVVSIEPGIDCGSTCSALFSGPVTLLARTQNGQDSYFTSWSGSGCEGARSTCTLQLDRPHTLTASFAPMDHNLIFSSSKKYPPNLGGLAAYDAECNRLATAAGINDGSGSGFIALMTDAADSANPAGPLVERAGAARGWMRMDGLPVADESTTLFDTPYYTPTLTEQGELTNDLAWTGVGRGDANDDRCAEWTSNASTSVAGMGYPRHLGWLDGFAGLCDQTARIYCMGRSKQLPLGSVPSVPGKRLWLSFQSYDPGTTTPDAHCQADRPAGVQQALALIAYSGRPASLVIDPAATYVTPDGRLIGTGAQLLAGRLFAGPWLLSDGSTTIPNTGVWTGSTSADLTQPGTPASTCLDWTSNDPTLVANTGTTGYADDSFWWYGGIGAACSGETGWASSLYCVER